MLGPSYRLAPASFSAAPVLHLHLRACTHCLHTAPEAATPLIANSPAHRALRSPLRRWEATPLHGMLPPRGEPHRAHRLVREHPADTVFVTGDFDDWKQTVQLEKEDDGIFKKTVELPKAKHQYKVGAFWLPTPLRPRAVALGHIAATLSNPQFSLSSTELGLPMTPRRKKMMARVTSTTC